MTLSNKGPTVHYKKIRDRLRQGLIITGTNSSEINSSYSSTQFQPLTQICDWRTTTFRQWMRCMGPRYQGASPRRRRPPSRPRQPQLCPPPPVSRWTRSAAQTFRWTPSLPRRTVWRTSSPGPSIGVSARNVAPASFRVNFRSIWYLAVANLGLAGTCRGRPGVELGSTFLGKAGVYTCIS